MDQQIKNIECQYKLSECNNTPLVLLNGKWCCGNCAVEVEEKIKKYKNKLIQILENDN